MKIKVVMLGMMAIYGCVNIPDVYVVDRHTVMELEASGQWPELERRFHQQALRDGPTQLVTEPASLRKERSFRLLNSEFVVTHEEIESRDK